MVQVFSFSDEIALACFIATRSHSDARLRHSGAKLPICDESDRDVFDQERDDIIDVKGKVSETCFGESSKI